MRYKLNEFKVETIKINKKLTEDKVTILSTEGLIFQLAGYSTHLIDIGDLFLLKQVPWYNTNIAYYHKYTKDFSMTGGIGTTPEETLERILEEEGDRFIKRLKLKFPVNTEKDAVELSRFKALKQPTNIELIDYLGVSYLYSRQKTVN